MTIRWWSIMKIRIAFQTDINELASLMVQLGYETTVEEMKIRFTKIEEDPHYYTLVAVTEEQKVVGMIGLWKGISYERNESAVRIVALVVVNESHRQKGIGNQLIIEAEEWAKVQGAIGIGLNSGKRTERVAAHQFYKQLGYEDRSIGFVKQFK